MTSLKYFGDKAFPIQEWQLKPRFLRKGCRSLEKLPEEGPHWNQPLLGPNPCLLVLRQEVWREMHHSLWSLRLTGVDPVELWHRRDLRLPEATLKLWFLIGSNYVTWLRQQLMFIPYYNFKLKRNWIEGIQLTVWRWIMDLGMGDGVCCVKENGNCRRNYANFFLVVVFPMRQWTGQQERVHLDENVSRRSEALVRGCRQGMAGLCG